MWCKPLYYAANFRRAGFFHFNTSCCVKTISNPPSDMMVRELPSMSQVLCIWQNDTIIVALDTEGVVVEWVHNSLKRIYVKKGLHTSSRRRNWYQFVFSSGTGTWIINCDRPMKCFCPASSGALYWTFRASECAWMSCSTYCYGHSRVSNEVSNKGHAQSAFSLREILDMSTIHVQCNFGYLHIAIDLDQKTAKALV